MSTGIPADAKGHAAPGCGPGEQKWFAFPAVDTFGSLIGKVRIDITGGQWLPAGSYPYPGGVPVTVAAAKEQRPNPPNTADIVVTNKDGLGISGPVRGLAFDAKNELVGLSARTASILVRPPPELGRAVRWSSVDQRWRTVISKRNLSATSGWTNRGLGSRGDSIRSVFWPRKGAERPPS